MAQAEFSYSGEAHLLPGGRALVRGTRTSGGGRDKKHVFIEVECTPEEAGAVQKALALILQRDGRMRIAWRSAFDRSGPRPDLPEGCPEKFDWKLMREAWRYDVDRRPAIEVERVKYGGHVAIVRLTSDWQIENFVGPSSPRP